MTTKYEPNSDWKMWSNRNGIHVCVDSKTCYVALSVESALQILDKALQAREDAKNNLSCAVTFDKP